MRWFKAMFVFEKRIFFVNYKNIIEFNIVNRIIICKYSDRQMSRLLLTWNGKFVNFFSGKLNNKFKVAKKENPVVPKVADLLLASVSTNIMTWLL